jgi:hypothetical protein
MNQQPEVAVSAGQFIQWQDLFVMIDDGSLPMARYTALEIAIREQARGYPRGIGILVILPPETRPPPDDVKKCVKATLTRLAPIMSSLGYVIEGTGFKGVAARATLVGMKIFSSRPYQIYVETSTREAINKMTSHMANGHTVSVDAILKVITDARTSWRAPMPERAQSTEVTVK